MPQAKILPLLSRSHVFRQVDAGIVIEALQDCPQLRLMPGDTLIEAGTRNSTFYILLSGELRVYAGGRDMPANAILEAGDCVGELSLIDGERTSALVLAAAPSDLLAIPHERVWEIIDRCPVIARNLMAIMAGRLRRNNLTLLTTQDRSLEFVQASSVDGLTGLHNLQWLSEASERLIRRCRQDHLPVAVILADIDGLARINERNGYLTGDNILRRVARCLAESLRPQDLIGRAGGDEFVILLPGAALSEAGSIAERLCAATIAADIVVPPDLEPATISCGITAIKNSDDLAIARTRAGRARDRAKQDGRNRFALDA